MKCIYVIKNKEGRYYYTREAWCIDPIDATLFTSKHAAYSRLRDMRQIYKTLSIVRLNYHIEPNESCEWEECYVIRIGNKYLSPRMATRLKAATKFRSLKSAEKKLKELKNPDARILRLSPVLTYVENSGSRWNTM